MAMRLNQQENYYCARLNEENYYDDPASQNINLMER